MTARAWLGVAWRVLLVLAAVALVTPPVQVCALAFVNPAATPTMMARARETGTWPTREWRPLDALGHVPEAVVASEDQTFWEHRGFDPDAIEKAIAWNREHPERRRGASTITQQVARNVFLWQGGGWFRKGLEVVYTVWLEALLDKERILEVYLNVAETGPGTFGFEAGAEAWFGKPAADLTPMEAARLAAILPSPRKWDPHGEYAGKRARWILDSLPLPDDPLRDPPRPAPR